MKIPKLDGKPERVVSIVFRAWLALVTAYTLALGWQYLTARDGWMFVLTAFVAIVFAKWWSEENAYMRAKKAKRKEQQ